jgi:predicted component of type VI protein secretion system
VVLARTGGLGGIATPEPAGDEMAQVPLPEGWDVALEATEGPSSGKTFHIERSRVLIGRGKVEVSLADPTISRRHASLEVYGGTCVLLKDLGSTNGTFVNDQRVDFVELEDGDEIRIGRSRMTVTIAAPP